MIAVHAVDPAAESDVFDHFEAMLVQQGFKRIDAEQVQMLHGHQKAPQGAIGLETGPVTGVSIISDPPTVKVLRNGRYRLRDRGHARSDAT